MGWDLNMRNFTMNGQVVTKNTDIVLFELSKTYIYVNKFDFSSISQAFSTMFDNIDCTSQQYCKLSQSCDEVKKPTDPWFFNLLDDEDNIFKANLPVDKLFISGSTFGLSSTECVIPIFR